MKYFIGIDIGGTNIKYGLLDGLGTIVDKGQVKTMRDDGADIVAKIVEVVANYRVDYEVIAVGVSAPGSIRDDGFMITGGAIRDFYGINLKEQLESVVGLPVALENDANCAALAELWLGAGRGKQHFLQFVVGTAVGGAIVINGQLYKGANANAGEFGYHIVKETQNHDTRETTLSLNGSVGHGIVDKYKELTGLDGSGVEIYSKAAAGDAVATKIIDEFYFSLAKGIFNLTTAFDPEVILIGGAISQNPELISRIEKNLVDLKSGHRDMGSVGFAPLQACQFLNDAGMIGAVYNATKL